MTQVPSRLDGRLGRQLKATRRTKRLAISALAARAGVSRRYVAAVENGANVSVCLLIRIAQTLGLTQLELGDDICAEVMPRTREIADALMQMDRLERGIAGLRAVLGYSPGTDRSLAPLHLSRAALAALEGGGIHTLAELLRRTDHELL